MPWVQSPIRPNNHRRLHQFIAFIFIYSTKWPSIKSMNAKNTKKSLIHENADANITCNLHAYSYIQQSGRSIKSMNAKNTKKSLIHENADANITCNFGDVDISCSRSRLPHGQTHAHTATHHTQCVSSIIVRLPPCSCSLGSGWPSVWFSWNHLKLFCLK